MTDEPQNKTRPADAEKDAKTQQPQVPQAAIAAPSPAPASATGPTGQNFAHEQASAPPVVQQPSTPEPATGPATLSSSAMPPQPAPQPATDIAVPPASSPSPQPAVQPAPVIPTPPTAKGEKPKGDKARSERPKGDKPKARDKPIHDEPKAGEKRPERETKDLGPRPAPPVNAMPFEIPPDVEKELAGIDPLTLTREQLTQLIIKRHEMTVRTLLDKIKENNKFITENQSELDEQKRKRDKLNAAVAEIKDQRQGAQLGTKKLREELFSLLEKDTDIVKITRELDVYKRHMEDVDWKLQTTAITLERERELVEEIRQDMKKIRALSTDIQSRQGISDKVNDISSKLDTGFASAQTFHEAMLEMVTQAEGHHSRWVELRRGISDRIRQNSWLEHRMKMHADNLNYWVGLQGGKK